MISVCMATYNGEKYIKKQINSILKQINKNDELIISDDGSTDKTKSILQSYAEKYPNIRIIEGPQKGVIKNFENALNNSKGDMIFLSDQDDIWLDNKVKNVLKEFDKGFDLVLHDAIIVDKNENMIEESFFYHRKSKKGFLNNTIKNSYIGCCMAFSRNVLNYALPFPDSIEMHDWWIGLIAERVGKVSLLNDKLLLYRRHGNNVSSFRHYPLKKMISNRVYILFKLILRLKKVKKC